MSSTTLTAHWRSLFENKYLGAWNLFVNGQYRTATVTIDRLSEERVTMQGGRSSMALLMHFKGKQTPMIVTKTMGKAIERMHGKVTAGWIGKTITLYVEQGFKAKDGPADVLRIKNEKASQVIKEQLQEQSAPPEEFFDDGSDDPDKGP